MIFQGVKTIYFDFDGTVHNSVKIYIPAFKKAYDFLVKNNKAIKREWKNEEITKWLGYTRHEMWENFMKELEEPYKNRAGVIVGKEMQKQVIDGNARLYDNAENVLMQLKNRGYKLIFLSNCSMKYMEASTKAFNLNLYFDDMFCSEMYDFIPKHEILKIIKNNYENNQVIIGDRFHDIDSAVENGIESIYCQYGYGEAGEGDRASAKINDITEILDFFPPLSYKCN